MLAAIVLQINKATEQSDHKEEMHMLSSPYFWLIVGAAIVAAFQTWVNYTKDWYSPTLALKYQDLFESDRVCKARSMAAKQYQKNGEYDGESKDVETILDLFEDIGFYVEHDEISPEVAHHHFDYWIRGYVQTAEKHIAERRRDDPTMYDHLNYLLDATNKVEEKRSKKHLASLRLNKEEIDDFLKEEAGMSPPISSTENPQQ